MYVDSTSETSTNCLLFPRFSALYVTPHLQWRIWFRMSGLWSDTYYSIPNFATHPDVEKIITGAASSSDGLGFVYVYLSKPRRPGRRAPPAFIRQRGGRARYRRAYKIGRTNNIMRRKAEWRRQCPGEQQEWMLSWR
ncbi:hypothetical protein B0H10DRAFT_1950887, partial [Mycena sp. CBHHK59/15]